MNSLLFWFVVTLVLQVIWLVNHGIENVTPTTITLMVMVEIAMPPLIKSYIVEPIGKWYKR